MYLAPPESPRAGSATAFQDLGLSLDNLRSSARVGGLSDCFCDQRYQTQLVYASLHRPQLSRLSLRREEEEIPWQRLFLQIAIPVEGYGQLRRALQGQFVCQETFAVRGGCIGRIYWLESRLPKRVGRPDFQTVAARCDIDSHNLVIRIGVVQLFAVPSPLRVSSAGSRNLKPRRRIRKSYRVNLVLA